MKLLIILLSTITLLLASIDVNNATKKELKELRGVGNKKASAIVNHRKTVDCFKTVDDITKIKGIGKVTVSKNKDNLIAGKCEN
jgi:competence protein ComEA